MIDSKNGFIFNDSNKFNFIYIIIIFFYIKNYLFVNIDIKNDIKPKKNIKVTSVIILSDDVSVVDD
tara:strand:+ start:484 stop:681 length:198 start_codon:yes stop_codon:yes gene_type:complete